MTDETYLPPALGTDATQADAQPGTDTGASVTGITAEQGPTDGNGSPVKLTEEARAEGRAKRVEAIAQVGHETNRAYCRLLGDNSQPAWEDAPDWQRQSAIKGVEFQLGGVVPAFLHIELLHHIADVAEHVLGKVHDDAHAVLDEIKARFTYGDPPVAGTIPRDGIYDNKLTGRREQFLNGQLVFAVSAGLLDKLGPTALPHQYRGTWGIFKDVPQE